MIFRRPLVAFLSAVFLAAVCGILWFVHPVKIQTSLYDLLGSAAESIPGAVRDGASDVVPILISSKDEGDAIKTAEILSNTIPTNGCANVRFKVDGAELESVLDFCASNSVGLVSLQAEELLKTTEGRKKWARRNIRSTYSSPTRIFNLEVDPFGLTESFVTQLPQSFSSFSPKEDFLCANKDGITYVLLVLQLDQSIVNNIDALVDFGETLNNHLKAASNDIVTVTACGVPMHSAAAASNCKREISILSFISLFFVVFLSLYAFRSLKSLLLISYLFTFALFAGVLTTMLFYSTVHIISLVFATTILGLVIDYGYHWMLQNSGSERKTIRSLLISLATTLISLLPLFLSSLPVLRQSATFLASALVAAAICVVLFFPSGFCVTTRQIAPPKRFLSLMGIVVTLVGVVGFFAVKFDTAITSLYSPSKELALAERTFAELNSSNKPDSGFVVVGPSENLEELLEKEEVLFSSNRVPRLSLFMPSLKKRMAIYENVKSLYEEQGDMTCTQLGIEKGNLVPPSPPRPWQWNDVPESLKSGFVRERSLVVSSVTKPDGEYRDGVVFCQPRQAIESALSGWIDEICSKLIFSFGVLLLVLIVVFKFDALFIALPPLAAIVSVIGILSVFGVDITLFHLLALFLLAGMGVDYAVFLRSGEENSVNSVTMAMLTSLVGFGALAFVSFPVVRAFGMSLGIGLPVAYAMALLLVPKKPSTEHAATPLGLSIIWFIYKIFGLRVFHFAASCVGFFMWLFSPSVRRASPQLSKTINFTRSLADKIVTMADGGSSLRVVLDDSHDAMAFRDDVMNKRGVFVISSHVGTIEVLAALGECPVMFHAWMEFSRTSVFNAFYLKHKKRMRVEIHPISEFGPQTVFFAGDALDAGDAVLMAGDRSFGRKRIVRVEEEDIELAEGVFRFASLLEHPIYFVSCIATSGTSYKAYVKRLPSDAKMMAEAYAKELVHLRKLYPMQDFRWSR